MFTVNFCLVVEILNEINQTALLINVCKIKKSYIIFVVIKILLLSSLMEILIFINITFNNTSNWT